MKPLLRSARLCVFPLPFVLSLAFTPIESAQATFHGNIDRTGVYESAAVANFSGVKWAFKTDGAILGSPAIADGVVYIGSTDGYLYAIDQETGQQKWKVQRGLRRISSTPAVSGGMLYAMGDNGVLAAIAISNGERKWYFATKGERRFQAKGIHGNHPSEQTIPDSWDVYTSSPAVYNGRVYVGSGDGSVYAVDAQTGLLVWKFATGDVVHASPAIANNTVFIGSWDSNLYALDADSGQEKWHFKAGEDPVIHNQVGFQSSPAVVDGVVYVGCRDGHVYALDAANGKEKWDYSTSKSWVNSTPAVSGGLVYVGTSDTSQFLTLDAKTGRLHYSVSVKAWTFSSAAVAGGFVYIGDENGKLYAFDTKSGKTAWEFQTDSAKKDPLKILNPDGSFNVDTLFTPVFNDFEDMPLAISRIFGIGGIFSSPVVDRGTVYVASTDGYLYALR